jgi:hypothetical protein
MPHLSRPDFLSPTRIPAELQMRIDAAREAAASHNRALKRALHRGFARLTGTERHLLKAALAEALETSGGTIARQAKTGDLPFQARVLSAAQVLAPELYDELLDVLGQVLNIEWRPAFSSVGDDDVIKAARRAARDGTELALAVYDSTEDGTLCHAERADLIEKLDKAEHSLKDARAHIETLETHRAVGAS